MLQLVRHLTKRYKDRLGFGLHGIDEYWYVGDDGA
jgi:hypothetical protein